MSLQIRKIQNLRSTKKLAPKIKITHAHLEKWKKSDASLDLATWLRSFAVRSPYQSDGSPCQWRRSTIFRPWPKQEMPPHCVGSGFTLWRHRAQLTMVWSFVFWRPFCKIFRQI